VIIRFLERSHARHPAILNAKNRAAKSAPRCSWRHATTVQRPQCCQYRTCPAFLGGPAFFDQYLLSDLSRFSPLCRAFLHVFQYRTCPAFLRCQGGIEWPAAGASRGGRSPPYDFAIECNVYGIALRLTAGILDLSAKTMLPKKYFGTRYPARCQIIVHLTRCQVCLSRISFVASRKCGSLSF
jgi:hypothetical protein